MSTEEPARSAQELADSRRYFDEAVSLANSLRSQLEVERTECETLRRRLYTVESTAEETSQMHGDIISKCESIAEDACRRAQLSQARVDELENQCAQLSADANRARQQAKTAQSNLEECERCRFTRRRDSPFRASIHCRRTPCAAGVCTASDEC